MVQSGYVPVSVASCGSSRWQAYDNTWGHPQVFTSFLIQYLIPLEAKMALMCVYQKNTCSTSEGQYKALFINQTLGRNICFIAFPPFNPPKKNSLHHGNPSTVGGFQQEIQDAALGEIVDKSVANRRVPWPMAATATFLVPCDRIDSKRPREFCRCHFEDGKSGWILEKQHGSLADRY